MAGITRFWQSAMRTQQRPLFGEAGYRTTTRSADVDVLLQQACCLSSTARNGSRVHISSVQFVHISQLVGMLDQQQGRQDREKWSLRPRLYTLLRRIKALDYMDDFAKNNIFDISLPFSNETLPDFLSDPALRQLFLDTQACVLTDARLLESREDHHLNLVGSADEHLVPFQHLGSGTFGAVDLVCSRLSAKVYARKRVFRGRDSDATRREQQYLIEEIRILKRLSHRHLTEIIQSYSDRDYIGYLMEPIAECNLHTFLVRRRISDGDVVHLRHFFGCLAGAVYYLHSRKIRHRDLKLENILVKQSRVYVADFGSALEWTTAKRGTTHDRSTPVTEWYMAPEVDVRAPRNFASDMWSLGLVFLEMLTVIKGQTVPKWKDFFKKKALKAKSPPWPCQNIEIILEWMEFLQMCPSRYDVFDDDSIALKDNAPLQWIREILMRQPDSRLTAQRLVKSIAESGYLLDFACFDCIHDFQDAQFLQIGLDGWAQRDNDRMDREKIDNEVTALLSMTNTVEQQRDKDAELTVMNWLAESNAHWEGGAPATRPTALAVPGAFIPEVNDNFVDDDIGDVGTPDSKPSTRANLADNDVNEPSTFLHERGFFVDRDVDSSTDGSVYVDVESPGQETGLFPIILDTNSESSEEFDIEQSADTKRLDEIDNFALSTLLEEDADGEATPQSTSNVRKDSVVRFDTNILCRTYVEDEMSELTIERDSKQRALPLEGPVLQERGYDDGILDLPPKEENIPMDGVGEHQDSPETARQKPTVEPLTAAEGNLVGTEPTQGLHDLVSPVTLLPTQHSTAINTQPSIPTPWFDNPNPSQTSQPSRVVCVLPLPQPWHGHTEALSSSAAGALTDGGLIELPVSDSTNTLPLDYLASKDDGANSSSTQPWACSLHRESYSNPLEASLGMTETKKSRQGIAKRTPPLKLSEANIGRLNKANKDKKDKDQGETDKNNQKKSPTKRLAPREDDFSPASFIESAWNAAEAADSLATSIVSDKTSRKLRGIGLRWNDKSYKYLEYYCRVGKAGAVRLLLDQGCNSGTILSPRPKPLFNAIEGCSARHVKCVEKLIKAGCDVNARLGGRSALHAAIEQPFFKGFQKLIALLLAAGADVNRRDSTGECALTKLFKDTTGTPLEEYQRQCLALMLNPKVPTAVDVNLCRPVTMETPLHLAVRSGTAQAVALLVHARANTNAKDASGTTPLLTAANQWRRVLDDQQERILTFLLYATDIDLNVTGGSLRRTALHQAAAVGCQVAFDRLCERGGNPHLLDKQGYDAFAILDQYKTTERDSLCSIPLVD